METTLEPSWSLGTLIGLPIGILLVLACVAGGVFSLRLRRQDKNDPSSYHDDGWGWWAAGAFAVAVIFALITAAMMYPYTKAHHQWTPVAGQVTDISDRFIRSGESVEQRIVVVLDDGQAYGCDDTRCALLESGDSVELLCKLEFQYASEDGYGCRFVRSTAS